MKLSRHSVLVAGLEFLPCTVTREGRRTGGSRGKKRWKWMPFPRSLGFACPLAGDRRESRGQAGEGRLGWAQLPHPSAGAAAWPQAFSQFLLPIQGTSRLYLLLAFVCFVFDDVMVENLNT